jgi:hypothetical protein
VAGDDGEITEAIEQLRSQLTAVQTRGRDEKLRFQITEVEMEFLVEVRKEGAGKAGLRLGVVSLGADGKVSQGTTHRLKLKLDVTDESGGKATVSGKR